MVKKIILLVLFALLIVFSFYQNSFLNKNGKYFASQIVNIEAYINNDDYDSAQAGSQILFTVWEDIKPKYELFCEHEEVDKIHASFEKLLVLVNQKNELCLTQTALLKYYFDHIINIDSFSFENIF